MTLLLLQYGQILLSFSAVHLWAFSPWHLYSPEKDLIIILYINCNWQFILFFMEETNLSCKTYCKSRENFNSRLFEMQHYFIDSFWDTAFFIILQLLNWEFNILRFWYPFSLFVPFLVNNCRIIHRFGHNFDFERIYMISCFFGSIVILLQFYSDLFVLVEVPVHIPQEHLVLGLRTGSLRLSIPSVLYCNTNLGVFCA